MIRIACAFGSTSLRISPRSMPMRICLRRNFSEFSIVCRHTLPNFWRGSERLDHQNLRRSKSKRIAGGSSEVGVDNAEHGLQTSLAPFRDFHLFLKMR